MTIKIATGSRKPRRKPRLNRNSVTEIAWAQSAAGFAFTAEQLAEKCHMTANRHFRQHLNNLARLGLLAVRRPLCTDGHYRKFFMSHETAKLYPNIQERMF